MRKNYVWSWCFVFALASCSHVEQGLQKRTVADVGGETGNPLFLCNYDVEDALIPENLIKTFEVKLKRFDYNFNYYRTMFPSGSGAILSGLSNEIKSDEGKNIIWSDEARLFDEQVLNLCNSRSEQFGEKCSTADLSIDDSGYLHISAIPKFTADFVEKYKTSLVCLRISRCMENAVMNSPVDNATDIINKFSKISRDYSCYQKNK